MKNLSVTTVLSKYQDWSRVDPDTLEAACQRGNAVDNYCNALARGEYAIAPTEFLGYCMSFARWFDANVIEVIAVQPELEDDTFGFLGHPDLLAVLRGDRRPSVIDNKTPDALHPAWKAQCAAYLHLSAQFDPARCGSLRLRKDGSPAIFNEYTDAKEYFQAFLSALFAHKFFLGKE